MKSKSKRYIIHEKDLILNRDKVKSILDSRGMNYRDFYEEIQDFGIKMTYAGFMNLLYNRTTWKLLYAWAIADVLNVDIKNIFTFIDINESEALLERREWEKKYQNQG